MPFTLDQLEFLGVHVGVVIPPEFIEHKRRAEAFKTRREKIVVEAGGKPADWRLKADFDAALKAALDSAGNQKFDLALQNLDQAEQLLQQPEAAPEAAPTSEAASGAVTGGEGGFSIVQLQKNRLAWDGLRKSVRAQLQELEKSIIAGVRAHNADETAEDEFEEGAVGGAVKTLHTILGEHAQRLLDKLDEALNAQGDEQRRGRHQEAAGIIKEYQAFVASDPTLAMIDENGFTKSTIRSELVNTLGALAGKF